MSTPTTPPAAAPSRERRKSARRDAILAAARKVFASKGFDGATMADIAREAGVAAGTVYLYYDSKLDLFAELNGKLYRAINRALADANAPADLRGSTRALVHAVFEAGGEHRDLLRLVFLNPDPRTEVARRMRRADEERLGPLSELLATAMRNGIVRAGDATMLARLINGLVIAALYQCFVQSDGREVQPYEDTVVDMVVGGLAPA